MGRRVLKNITAFQPTASPATKYILNVSSMLAETRLKRKAPIKQFNNSQKN
jgi:hypothetical protein